MSTKARFHPLNDLLPSTIKLSDRWALTLRGDGPTGATDGSSSASANVQYHAGPGFWVFGYCYLDVELLMRDSALDLTLHGPQVGHAFTF
ncbi:hypothetical protein [Lysobacter auxotrophicus]|uniref:Uncharacterized protein n=1 Tax=Lysobacter auxotrophicus TaxID=2992573 RepID=A0ABM8DDG8_9GAMM|nr:hypothetical protein [Lysobacter auxotrophicus]BDU16629.1 hypothetical protein LA521A_18300 [Lysobacter auxotrophicus]